MSDRAIEPWKALRELRQAGNFWPPSAMGRRSLDAFSVTVTVDTLVANDFPNLAAQLWMSAAKAMDDFEGTPVVLRVEKRRECGYAIEVQPPVGSLPPDAIGAQIRALEDAVADRLGDMILEGVRA